MSTESRDDQLLAALKTAVAASQVAQDLASRLADRVTKEEAMVLLCVAVNRSSVGPIGTTGLIYLAQHGGDDYNLPAQYLAQRLVEEPTP